MNITTWHNAEPGTEGHVSTRPGDQVQAPGSGDITHEAIRSLWDTEHESIKDAETERTLVSLARKGNDEARLHLLKAFMPVLKGTAAGYGLADGDNDDVRQQAVLGFFEALTQVPEGGRVSQYVVRCVRSVLEEMGFAFDAASTPKRTRQRFVQVLKAAGGDPDEAAALAPSLGMSTEVFWAAFSAASFGEHRNHPKDRDDVHTLAEELHPEFEAEYANVDDRMTVLALVVGAGLDPRERAVVDAYAEGTRDTVIAAALGIDRTRVVHIRAAAFAKMRETSGASEEIA